MERLNAIIASARRTEQSITLIIFDLDNFKGVNDSHGHLAGDAVLAGLGRLLRKRFRVEDLRGRWGGDEFILALVGSNREQSAQLMRGFLVEYAKLDFKSESGDTFHATLSAGVAEFRADGTQIYELLKIADQRLYEAKRRGRNCVVADSESLAEGVESKT
jgi:diguanylate cyclase (GGDEF)-like protein